MATDYSRKMLVFIACRRRVEGGNLSLQEASTHPLSGRKLLNQVDLIDSDGTNSHIFEFTFLHGSARLSTL